MLEAIVVAIVVMFGNEAVVGDSGDGGDGGDGGGWRPAVGLDLKGVDLG